jgi:hypothetical protein
MLDRKEWKVHPMKCPHCQTNDTRRSQKVTGPGYPVFNCPGCERTGEAFTYLQFPTDIVRLVVLWRLRYKLSLHDLTEMFPIRGYEFTHEAVREWEECFAPLLSGQLKAKRRLASLFKCRRRPSAFAQAILTFSWFRSPGSSRVTSVYPRQFLSSKTYSTGPSTCSDGVFQGYWLQA